MSTSNGAAKTTIREIDKSQPSATTVTGVPITIIGTSVKGQAFVPITIGTYSDFTKIFGESDGKNFGTLAAYNYLGDSNNNSSLTFMRILGVGKGLSRDSSDAFVDGAGFTVGIKNDIDTSSTANSTYAYAGGSTGRTYFLGCFMSEANGSTFFRDAGLPASGSSATPIVRGIIMTASGVLASLSSSLVAGNTPPTTAVSNANLAGSTIGTLIDENKFVLILNGKKTLNTITASFDLNSSDYFVNLLNKDPLRIEEEGYCLYSHFDVSSALAEIDGTNVVSSSLPTGTYPLAFITSGSATRNTYPANANSAPNFESFVDRFDSAKTPWLISQTYAGKTYNLFRLHDNSDGEISFKKRVKFTIENLTPGNINDKFGKFDLLIRDINDVDSTRIILEQFRGLSLDPSSKQFIGKRIGNLKLYFDFDKPTSAQKLVLEGDYNNISNYVRVEIHQDVTDGLVPEDALPIGFRGPQHLCLSGTSPLPNIATNVGILRSTALQKTVELPIPFRVNISNLEVANPQSRADSSFCWGVQFEHPKTTLRLNGSTQNEGLNGYLKYYPTFNLLSSFAMFDNEGDVTTTQFGVTDCDRYNNNKFTLENIQVITSSLTNLADPAKWQYAQYIRSGNITPNPTNNTRAWSVSDLSEKATRTYSKFNFFAFGGFNGVNIFDDDKSKLTNAAVEYEYENTATITNAPTVMSYVKALDILKNTSEVDMQMLAIPGIRNEYVTNYALEMVRDRFDSLYIMDINQYDTNGLLTQDYTQTNVKITSEMFDSRQIDNSFGAAYFPDIMMLDPNTQSTVVVPASAAVLRAFAINDTVGKLWNAPAGYNRAALNQAGAKPSVILSEQQLDILYDARINPIKIEQGDPGPVVWGQKTLQLANTSLNRINVRRLLLTLRRQVRAVANKFIFEPNRETTLTRFSSLVQPILANIQTLNGISQYKVQIDTTTTTQQDIENNTVRGKIFIVPVNSVEFISVDFEITNKI